MEAMAALTVLMAATAVGRRRWGRRMVGTAWCAFFWQDSANRGRRCVIFWAGWGDEDDGGGGGGDDGNHCGTTAMTVADGADGAETPSEL